MPAGTGSRRSVIPPLHLIPPRAAGVWEEEKKQEHRLTSGGMMAEAAAAVGSVCGGQDETEAAEDGGDLLRGWALLLPSAVTELRPAAAAAAHRTCGSARHRIKAMEII